MKLTKKKLAALDFALTFDDILYEKFRRLNNEFQKEVARFYKSKRVVQVIQKKENAYHALQIEEIYHTPEGIRVIVI